MVQLSKTEKKYLLYVLGVAIGWTIIMTTVADFLQQQNVILQFGLITILEYALPGAVLAIYLNGGTLNLRKFAGSFFFFMSWDLIFPPLLLDIGGTLHTTGIAFGTASIDSVVAGFWNLIGITSWQVVIAGHAIGFAWLLYLLTYPITFILLQAMVVWLLTGRQIWELARS